MTFPSLWNTRSPIPQKRPWQRSYLKEHLDRKYSREDVIEIGEDVIPLAVLLHWVLGGQGNAAQDDDDHDERLEAGNRHDPVNQDPDPEKKFNLSFISIVYIRYLRS